MLVDVRGPKLYARRPRARRGQHPAPDHDGRAHGRSTRKDTAFVVYCAGPHCNGANKAAIRLARLGYRVKEMIGGITGWLDEDFALERDAAQETQAA